MKDISDKVTTLRTALARSVLRVTDSTIATIKAGEIPKGDPLVIAKVAAVQAAKNTSMIIPYCHQIAIDYVGVEYELTKDSIVIDVTVKATHKTGVEMEAMTAASVAALTIYDMVKPLDDFAEIEKVEFRYRRWHRIITFAPPISNPSPLWLPGTGPDRVLIPSHRRS